MGKINLEDRSRYVKRLHSRVMRRRKIQVAVFSVLFIVFLGWASVKVFSSLRGLKLPTFVTKKASAPAPKKKKAKLNFLVIGAEQRDYEQYVSGVSLVVFDPNEKKVNGLSFNKNLRLHIPEYGKDVLEKGLFASADSTLASITNITGIQVSKYLIVDSGDYGNSKKLVKRYFTGALQSNFSEKERTDLAKKISSLADKDINILEAPSKLISVGKKPYYQLKKKQLNRLIQILWDKPKPLKRLKAIVLNGIGTSGIAGKVAKKLIRANYEVIDIKNASSFNYKNTLIIVYSQSLQKEASAVQKLLGYGNTMLDQNKQGLTDMTIILGKDNKSGR